jgi:hypothetical protein
MKYIVNQNNIFENKKIGDLIDDSDLEPFTALGHLQSGALVASASHAKPAPTKTKDEE